MTAPIIGPLPNNILDGQPASAGPVMSNFNWIVQQVNQNGGGGGGGGGSAGVTNILYNGAMRLSQRQVSAALTLAAATGYTVDRWQGKTGAGASAAYSRITSIANPPFQYALRVQRTVSNAATTLIQVGQSLESIDCIPLQSQTVTLSFSARMGADYSAAAAALNGTVLTGTGTDENLFNSYTGAFTALSLNATLTSNWQRFQVTGAIPSSATEIGVVFTYTPVGTAGANDYFDITGVQLEVATTATAFGFPTFADEIAACQRYYQKSFEIETAPVTNSTGNCAIFNAMVVKAGASGFFLSFCLPTRMRDALATGVIYNPQVANNQLRDTAGSDFSGSSISALGISATVLATGPSGAAVGDQVWFNWSLDCEL